MIRIYTYEEIEVMIKLNYLETILEVKIPYAKVN